MPSHNPHRSESRRGPLTLVPPFGGHSTSPRARGEVTSTHRSRDAPWHPSLSTPRYESPSIHLPSKRREAGAARRTSGSAPAAEGRKPAADAASTIAFLSRTVQEPKRRRPRLTAPTAVMRRRFDPSTRPGPRFLESPGANGRTLPGASAASTSHSDHAPEGTMPKAARIGSVSLPLREPLPPRLRSTLAKASFRGRDSDSGTHVTYTRTVVKRSSPIEGRPFSRNSAAPTANLWAGSTFIDAQRGGRQ